LTKSIRLCLAMAFITVIDNFFRYLKLKWFLLIYIQIDCNAVLNFAFFQILLLRLLSIGTRGPVVHSSADEHTAFKFIVEG
jgi:hypothetical protein